MPRINDVNVDVIVVVIEELALLVTDVVGVDVTVVVTVDVLGYVVTVLVAVVESVVKSHLV